MTSSSKPSWAVLAVVVALLVAASSTAYAAGLAKNSVGTKQLKAGAVTAAKLKNGAVTGAKVRKGTIGGAQIKNGSIGRADLAAGVALPVTTNVYRELAVGDDVSLARVGGVAYRGTCTSPNAGTAIGRVVVKPVDESVPNSLNVVWVSSVDDISGTFTGPSGAATFFSTVVQAGGNASQTGRAAVVGTIQYLQQPASRVDIGVTATVIGPAKCQLRVIVTPTR